MRLKPFSAPQPLPGLRLLHCRKCRVVEIITARALHQIATNGRHVAQLRTRAGEQRLAQDRITLHDQRMLGDIGVAGERADANAFAVRQFFDLCQRQPVDVD